MEIEKGTRHQKVIGAFGEWLVCNWLSRSGFGVAVVDHTGIDLIAYHHTSGQRLGITVKSRTRTSGREATAVNLMRNVGVGSDRQKLLAACDAFACEPWIGVYVETARSADLYLISLAHYDAEYRNGPSAKVSTWRMDARVRQEYERDPLVRHIRPDFTPSFWWGRELPTTSA